MLLQKTRVDYLIANSKPITLPREYNSCFHIEAIQRALKGRPRKNGVGRVPMFGNDTLRASIPERGAIECLRHLNGEDRGG